VSGVLLIHAGIESCGFNSYGKGMEGSWVNHGLAAIGARLKDKDLEFDYLDLRRFQGWDLFTKEILKKHPDIAGISATTVDYGAALQCAKVIKEIRSATRVVLGGIHASVCPEKCIEERSFDHVLVGEGEITFSELIQKHREERIIQGTPMVHLDELPFIDRTIFGNRETSIYQKLFPEPFATFIASRGCPYQCTFCQPAERTVFGSKVRSRSPKNLIEEIMKCMKDDGIQSYLVHDDCLLWDEEWIDQFVNLLKKRNIRLPFAIQSRADLICTNVPRIKNLSKVGLAMMLVGFESGSQRVLDALQKGTTVEQNMKAAAICEDHHVAIWANYMFGIPGETKADVEKTIEMIRKMKPEVCSPAFFTPYPGSFLGRYCESNHLSLIRDYKDFRRDPQGTKIRGVDYKYLKKAVRQSKRESFLIFLINEMKKSLRDILTHTVLGNISNLVSKSISMIHDHPKKR
jgi:anaerobic magnesium-protoporphyrin IX monomethyl ester cyclase